MSDAQIESHGVKSSVTKIRKNEAKVIDCVLYTFSSHDGSNSGHYNFQSRKRKVLRDSIAKIGAINSDDWDVRSNSTLTHAVDLAYLLTERTKLEDACNEVRDQEASGN